jgi:hypothetical protein
MADGFLGRWSKRKLDAREGKPVEEATGQPSPSIDKLRTGQASPAGAPGSELAPSPLVGEGGGGGELPQPPPLTLEDANALTHDSDFRPFAARNVAPEVRNAAMKKLFSDPHFNVMDRLDTYIDDYSQPDPIPSGMLRNLASARFLGLFDAEEKQEAEEAEAAARLAGREVSDNPTAQTVAQSSAAAAVSPAPTHDDPDLRLQPDDAPPGEDPGSSAA